MEDIQEINQLQSMMTQALTLNSAVSEEVLSMLSVITERLGRLENHVLGYQNSGLLSANGDRNANNHLTNSSTELCIQDNIPSNPLNPSTALLMPPKDDQELDSEPSSSSSPEQSSQELASAENSHPIINEPSKPTSEVQSEPPMQIKANPPLPLPRNPSSSSLIRRDSNGSLFSRDMERSNTRSDSIPSQVKEMHSHSSNPKFSMHRHETVKGGSFRKPPLSPSELPHSLSTKSDSVIHRSNHSESHRTDVTPGDYVYDMAMSKSIYSTISFRNGSSRSNYSDNTRMMLEEFDEILGSCSVCLCKEDLQQKLKEIYNLNNATPSLHNFFVRSSDIPPLQEMVAKLVNEGFVSDCLETYRLRRRRELHHNLQNIGVENLKKEEFENMDWESLESRIKNWMLHMQIFVRVLIEGERLLCSQIFEGFDHLSAKCFPTVLETTWLGMLRLGKDMASCKLSPEKVTRLLDMFDCVYRLKPHVDHLLEEEDFQFFSQTLNHFLSHQIEIVRDTFKEFAKLVECDGIDTLTSLDHSSSSIPSIMPSPNQRSTISSLFSKIKKISEPDEIAASRRALSMGLDIYPIKSRLPLTSYVVNYAVFLCNRKEAYWDLLKLVYFDCSENDKNGIFGRRAGIFRHLIRALVDNLEKKSRLLVDEGSRHTFLINNLRYVECKIENSDVKDVLGVERMRELNKLIQQHSFFLLNYVLNKFNDFSELDKADSATLLKRLTCFNSALEDLFSKKDLHTISDKGVQSLIVKQILEKIYPAYSDLLEKHGALIGSKKKLKNLCVYHPNDVRVKLIECFPLQ